MFASARKAAELIFDRAFLHVVLKAVGLTVLLFLILFAGVEYAFYHLPIAHSAGVNAALSILGLIVFLLLAMFLGAPVAALFASLFVDDIATAVEATYYPDDPPARGAPFWQSLLLGLRLFVLLVIASVLLLPADFLLAVGTAIFRIDRTAPSFAHRHGQSAPPAPWRHSRCRRDDGRDRGYSRG